MKIKIGFTDYFETLDKFFIDTLSKRFEVERDDQNPDYLFFADETFGRNNQTFDNRGITKIFFTGENRRPWNYKADYFLTFDHMSDSRHYRLPLYVLDNWVHQNLIGLPDIRQGRLYADKIDFCSFVVANSGCTERNNIFHKLSAYKKVNSGGPLFNNVGFVLPRDGINAQKTKFQFLAQHKFNICYENSSYPGYVTEKLFHAFYCSTVPIYWGSPTVEVDFNPDAFINRFDYSSDEEMIEHIIELDKDDDKYNEMLALNPLSVRNKVLDLDRFLDWFTNNVYKGEK
jgi:alpha(1,3/1,4) fucosyltransferase